MILDSPRQFFKKKGNDLDGLVYSAEAGSAWTLLYPDYSVAVPHPDVLRVPVAFPAPRGDREFVNFLNAWLDLKKEDRTLESLYDYWILGKGAEKKEPRWSVIRNVLHWMDSGKSEAKDKKKDRHMS